jgi:acetate kinase
MTTAADHPVILVLNAGSSSIKFAIFDTGAEGAAGEGEAPLSRTPLWGGKVEGIGSEKAQYSEQPADPEEKEAATKIRGEKPQSLRLSKAQPYHDALDHIRARVQARLGKRSIKAVAHRVVHGGTKYFEPVRVDKTVLEDLRSYIPLAPLHQPFALEAIDVLLRTRADLPQVACFDTGFHHTLPDVEKMLPLPYDAWEHGLRRFGFHGLSYQYQSIALVERYGDVARGRVIVAHLGNGASLCGMKNLRSVVTTMGFSALDGLMMGTRSGAIDPGALIFLMEIKKLSLERVSHILYHESGLLGVSGISSDPRDLLAKESTEPRAVAALALYCRRFVHEFGAMVAALGGLDMLVFTAGIGEHSAEMRARLCAPLAFMGIAIDVAENTREGAESRVISTAASRIPVVVEPTNEEWIAARAAQTLL